VPKEFDKKQALTAAFLTECGFRFVDTPAGPWWAIKMPPNPAWVAQPGLVFAFGLLQAPMANGKLGWMAQLRIEVDEMPIGAVPILCRVLVTINDLIEVMHGLGLYLFMNPDGTPIETTIDPQVAAKIANVTSKGVCSGGLPAGPTAAPKQVEKAVKMGQLTMFEIACNSANRRN